MPSSARPTRQQSRSLRTRDHIAFSALRVFAEKGYVESSMDDICIAAACSKGGLYHHFKTKEAVLEQVVEKLGQCGALQPPVAAAATALELAEERLACLLVDIWTEASRNGAVQARIAASANGTGLTPEVLVSLGQMVQAVALTTTAAPLPQERAA
jgi:AcrR family transcriptional regulator